MKLRTSTIADAKDFVRIKKALPLSTQNDHARQGGFLLGTDLKTYEYYIDHGYCLSATVGNEIVGFGIMLPNNLVKQSDLWKKRKAAKWSVELATLEKSNISYLEQLAFLRGYRKLTLKLAFNLVHQTFLNGTDYVLTTTVREPFVNKAAIPLIRAAKGVRVGNIDEVYPEIGEINSDIYLIKRELFYESILKMPLYEYLIKNPHR